MNLPPSESKGKFFQNLSKGEVWSIYVERQKPIFLFFSPQFKIVTNIDKIALHDEQPIIWRIDVAEAEYVVASKEQEGGRYRSFQRRTFQFQRKVSVGGDFKVVQYESTSKMLDLFYNFICCIFSITKLH